MSSLPVLDDLPAVEAFAATALMHPGLLARILTYPDDDTSVAAASAAHHQHGLDDGWPVLAKWWLAQGHTWPQIAVTLGLDDDDDENTGELNRQHDTIEQLQATVEARDRTIAALSSELEDARAHAAARAPKPGAVHRVNTGRRGRR